MGSLTFVTSDSVEACRGRSVRNILRRRLPDEPTTRHQSLQAEEQLEEQLHAEERV
jgi:hypothetical protein